jgi:aminoglycoside 3-N-acetyltransferase
LSAKANASPLRQSDIEHGLERLGLRRGDAVEVHSSLSHFGHVIGGAPTIIAALINSVGSAGALVMSAYPVSSAIALTQTEVARGITWKVRILAPDSTERTGMGRVADEFSRRPDVMCGHGIHRVCAWGHEAARHSQGYQHLLEIDGWALLMGVGIDRCSSMHEAEKVGFPSKIAKIFELPADIRRDYPADLWGIGYGSTPMDPWSTILSEAEAQGLIRRRTIGRAECVLFKARALVNEYADHLRTDPFAIFGLVEDR